MRDRIPAYNPDTARLASLFLSFSLSIIKRLLSVPRRDWRSISLWIKRSLYASLFVGQKWIRRLWKANTMDWDDIFVNERVGCVYALFNPTTKRIYIGQTGRTAWRRYQETISAAGTQYTRKSYRYMTATGLNNWICMPLECASPTDDTLRLRLEKQWMHRFRSTLINDPSTWKYKHPSPANTRQHTHIIRRIADAKRWRANFFSTITQSNWHDKTTTELMDIMINAAKYRLGKRALQVCMRRAKPTLAARGVDIKMEYRVRVNIGISDSRHNYMKITQSLLSHSTLDHRAREWIARRIKIIACKSRTVLQVVENVKKTLSAFNPDAPVDISTPCACCAIFPSLPRANGHLQASAIDLPDGALRDLLTRGSNDALALDRREFRAVQSRWMRDFCTQFNIPLTHLRHNKLFNTTIQTHTPPAGHMTATQVSLLLRPLGDTVRVRIDKNAGCFALVCPRLYLHRVALTFGTSAQPIAGYELVRAPVERTIAHTRIDSLSILSAPLPFSKKAQLPTAYLLPKQKDLSRVRPLVSFYKFGGRPTGRLIARALTVIIRELERRWKTMNLNSATDILPLLLKPNKIHEWKQPLSRRTVTYVGFDIKNQFTSLDRDEVNTALAAALRTVTECTGHTSVAVARLREMKKKDHLGGASKFTHHTIPFSTITQYVQFEMRHTFFTVGSTTYRQTGGLPIGGLVSAPLAVIDSMWKEHSNRHLWRQWSVPTQSIRYRDDIRMLFGAQLTQAHITEIQRGLQQMYGNSLEVELEYYSHEYDKFLESLTWVQDGKLQALTFNKNIDIRPGMEHAQNRFVRWPSPQSNLPRQTMVNTIAGAFKRTNFSSSPLQRGLAIHMLIDELLQRRYPANWIRSAIFKSNAQEWKSEMLVHLKTATTQRVGPTAPLGAPQTTQRSLSRVSA